MQIKHFINVNKVAVVKTCGISADKIIFKMIRSIYYIE